MSTVGTIAVYISNAIDGDISVYRMSPADGALAALGRVTAGPVVMPMAVSPDKRHLYAVVRSAPIRVLTYGIDAHSGALAPVAEAPLPESMPYAATDRRGRFFFTASYAGNIIAVSPIDEDGRITRPASQIVPTGTHAHAIQADVTNRFVFATSLGSDQIAQFRFDEDTGLLTPNTPATIATFPGEGPRHLAFSPDNRFAYVLHELSGTVSHYALNAETGTLSLVGSTVTVPSDAGLVRGSIQPAITAARLAERSRETAASSKPAISAADIQITPNGRFLFTTERTSSKLALLEIDCATGAPRYVVSFDTVRRPRGIKIDPTGRYLIASGEQSDMVAVYRIASDTGWLEEVGRYPGGRGANWVEIIDFP